MEEEHSRLRGEGDIGRERERKARGRAISLPIEKKTW